MDRGYRELVKNSKPWLSRVQEKDSSKTLKETLRAIGRKVSSFRFFRLKSYRNVRWGGNLFKLRGKNGKKETMQACPTFYELTKEGDHVKINRDEPFWYLPNDFSKISIFLSIHLSFDKEFETRNSDRKF